MNWMFDGISKTFRLGQLRAGETIWKCLLSGRLLIAIVLPTRYGKSDVMRIISALLVEQGIIGGAIALSPNLLLRKQLVSKKKIRKMVDMYHLPEDWKRKYRQVYNIFEDNLFGNGEYLLSGTMQGVSYHNATSNNIDGLLEAANHLLAKTGKPLLVFIDECHNVSEAQYWGDLVRVLSENNIPVVLMTATAIRQDKEMIPGFASETLETFYDVKMYKSTDISETERKVDVYSGTEVYKKYIADYELTFKEAWAEDPSPLAAFTRDWIEVTLDDFEKSGDETKLSQVSEEQARKVIGKAIRSNVVIEKGCRYFLASMQEKRRVNSGVQGIIFTANDINGDGNPEDDNAHARKIEKMLRDLQPEYELDLNIIIATMKSEFTEKTANVIEAFGEEYRGDVLILKAMGGAGFEAERAKVLMDLSGQRTIATMVQRLMRIATPWEGMSANAIMLGDAISYRIWEYIIKDAGGEEGVWKYEEMEWIDSYIKDKEPEDPELPVNIKDAYLGGYEDYEGHIGEITLRDAINRLWAEIPILDSTTSKARVAEVMVGSKMPVETKKIQYENTDEEIRRLQQSIFLKMTEKFNLNCKYNKLFTKEEKNQYEKKKRDWWIRLYNSNGIPKKTKLRQIVTVKTLIAMEEWIEKTNYEG